MDNNLIKFSQNRNIKGIQYLASDAAIAFAIRRTTKEDQ
jgi:hypothetical protein